MRWHSHENHPSGPIRSHGETNPILIVQDGFHRVCGGVRQLVDDMIISNVENGTINSRAALKQSRQIMNADLAAILFWDRETPDRRVLYYYMFDSAATDHLHHLQAMPKIQETGLARWLAESDRSTMIVHDAYSHPRFHAAFDEQTGYKTSCLALAKLKGVRAAAAGGVIAFLNKVSPEGFDQFDSEILGLLSSVISMSLLLEIRSLVNDSRQEAPCRP